jgi:tetratricopeptide (TPR) repeat protein
MMWLALAVAVSYANALTGSFQFDDFNVIVNEEQVHSWTNWYAALGNGIRPLLKLSYTANWTMGLGVLGFHLTNLLIHLLNAYLVYRLSQLFVQQQSRAAAMHHVPLLAALLFAAHPIHTEAVSYISGRSAALMTTFYLAALLFYVIGRTQQKPPYVYVATPLFFILALAVKETAVTLPLALLLWEASCGGRWRFELKPQWPSWLLLFIAAVFFLFSDNYLSQMERSAQINGLQGNLATQLAGFIYLMQQFVLPLWQNIDPDLPLLHELADALFPLAITIALLGLMIACWRRRPWISFALGWVMLHLIPLYILLPRIDIANERQLYLAAWPLLLALAIELTLYLDGKKWHFAAAGLLIACVALTVSRNQVYQNEIALWEDTVAKSPNKARAHNNLGYAYLLAQRKQEARRELSVALQLDPQLYQARYNLRRLDEEITSSP